MKKINLLLILLLALSVTATTSNAQVISVGVSLRVGPPAIPVYVQPDCPVDGYLWVPGYWSYGDDGYYWVPGYWSAPPMVGYLWTPGYWGYAGGIYGWNGGYWGTHVGFYGGVNYGFGYGGVGYGGGGWVGGHFRYNTAVTHVNTTIIHNTYIDRTVVHESGSRVAYNGGPGGVNARPTPAETQAANEHHIAATSAQLQHQRTAGQDRNQYASVNHGRPANAAVARTTAYHPANTAGSLSHSTAMNHTTTRPATSASHATNAPHTTSAPHTVNRPATVRHTTAPSHQTMHRSAPHPVQHAAPHGGEAPRGGGGGEHRPR
jgi:hypothetical protein